MPWQSVASLEAYLGLRPFLAPQEGAKMSLGSWQNLASLEAKILAPPESLAVASQEAMALASQEAILAMLALASLEAKIAWLGTISVSLETWAGLKRALGVPEEGWSPLTVVLAM